MSVGIFNSETKKTTLVADNSQASVLDAELSETSVHPVQNKTITKAINDLKKSVSDGKSAIASAITSKGVSTGSDASFETMSTNIGELCKDTTATHPSHILNGRTAYVQGQKITGTMISYYGFDTLYFSGNYMDLLCSDGQSLSAGGRCSLWKMTTSYRDTPFELKDGSKSGYVKFSSNAFHLENLDGDNKTQIYLSTIKTPDLSKYSYIFVNMCIKSNTYSDSTHFNGYLGLSDSNEKGSGWSWTDSKAVHFESTKADTWEYINATIDVSSLEGEKYLLCNLINGGTIQFNSLTFVPSNEG